MKTQLTPEQSQHLIELGVPFNKASICYSIASIGNGVKGIIKTGQQYIFTLTDLFEILPKEIELTDRIYNLDIVFWSNEVIAIYSIGAMFPIMIKRNKELIDALYKLTIWCIENGHLKFE